ASKHSTCLPCLPVVRSSYHYRSRRCRAGSSDRTHQGDRRHSGALQLSSYPCAVASGRVAHQPDAGLPVVPRNGLAIAEQDSEAQGQLREDRRSATQPNETRAMDFVHDQLATGSQAAVLTIIDTFSRFSPAIEPRFNFRGPDVVEILEEVGRQIGFPKA